MTTGLNVSYERAGRVAFVEIARPEADNRLTAEMMLDLAQAVTTLPAETGSVLLAGAGGIFCHGVDGAAAAAAARDGWSTTFEALVQANHDALVALLRCPVPLVAAIDGPASGIGLTCALMADTRLVTPVTRLIPNQIRVGLPLDTGLAYVLRRAFGPVQAMELLLDPDGMSGQDMLDRGLAHRPMQASGDREAWLDHAARIAELDAVAVQAARELLEVEDFEELWEREVRWLRSSMESGRLDAVLQRRFGRS